MNPVWALTGGIACGKSTLAKFLAQRGWKIIDTDEIAHHLMRPGEENWQNIIDVFGRNVLKHDETIDRRVLGDLVFHDSQLREKLNAITHPAIRRVWQAERQRLTEDNPACSLVVVIPLLFEKELDQEFTQIVCVGCSLSTQEHRLRNRGLEESQVSARLHSQWPVAEKLKRAHVALWNEGALTTLQRQLDFFAPFVSP
jgi:dephospho-CoA kinase